MTLPTGVHPSHSAAFGDGWDDYCATCGYILWVQENNYSARPSYYGGRPCENNSNKLTIKMPGRNK